MSNKHIITRRGGVAVLVATLVFLATSCVKELQPADRTASVSFSISGVTEGDISPQTKAASTTADIVLALAATRPTATPTLTVKSTTNTARRYTVEVGETIALPLDTYTVTGTYNPVVIDACLAGSMAKTPSYKIDQMITVTESSTAFELAATYTCFALILDKLECTAYKHYFVNSSYVDITSWVEKGNINIIYIQPTETIDKTKPYKVAAFPVNTAEYERRDYTLTSDGSGGTIPIVAGRWYRFSPSQCDTSSGDIGIDLPDWEQADI